MSTQRRIQGVANSARGTLDIGRTEDGTNDRDTSSAGRHDVGYILFVDAADSDDRDAFGREATQGAKALCAQGGARVGLAHGLGKRTETPIVRRSIGGLVCFGVTAHRKTNAEPRWQDRSHTPQRKVASTEMHSVSARRQSHVEAIVDIDGNLDDAHDLLGGTTQLGGVTVFDSDLNGSCPTTHCGTASVQDVLPLIELRGGHSDQTVIGRHN